MGGPHLVVRQKTLVPSKVILGPKKQRPASQNVERQGRPIKRSV
jgi:hypothetical protein